MTERKQFGTHYLVDFSGCEPERIKFVPPTQASMLHAAEVCGATLVDHRFHQYQPFGVSGIVLIAESHFSIHTWPEDGFAALDIFTCGHMNADAAIEALKVAFRAREVTVERVVRGQLRRPPSAVT